ncbi:DUF3383 family protein [Lentilactobacillus sp. SPB1-3]|uniref:DUF3383 family protein n=1 Tax=Lentilactobacillus terminaliae TaxID=3003483 RepID=A0ACD5DDC5_9LACO|nr:DUF3383 family protein [Lentilactobacillus sp. SPB1-3]MCZ0978042.1 DUF3383 family protein [Lentilactobacillus sp. SPB1-3]
MADVEKIETLSPINIITTYDRPVKAAGLAGVAYLVKGTKIALQSYHFLAEVEKDYDLGTEIYNAADNYFANDESPLFQVITSGPETAVTQPASTGDGSGSSTPAVTPTDADNMIAALTKYYNAGAEYFVIKGSKDNIDVVKAVSNFVEAQDNKVLIVDVPTDNAEPDLSFLSVLKGNKATLVLSLPKYGATDADYQLASTFLASYANSSVGTDPEFINQLGGVTPQDQYDFTKQALDAFYTPYHALTYAYRNGIPMFTSNKSQSGDQFSVMLIRDAITNEIVANITNLFVQNDRIPYNQIGIDLFKGQIKLVLDKYKNLGLIEPGYDINTINSDDISDNKKASGKLTGMGWKYQPVFSIDDTKFAQSITLPQPV